MKESRKSITILLITAGALAILLIALISWPKAQGYDASADQISIFSYKTSQVENVTLVRNEITRVIVQKDGEWVLADGTKLDYDDTDLLVTFISYLYSDNLVEEHAGNMSVYSLDKPSAAAAFTLKDGTTHVVDFGATSADRKSVYMRVDDSDTVYTIPLDVYNIIFADV